MSSLGENRPGLMEVSKHIHNQKQWLDYSCCFSDQSFSVTPENQVHQTCGYHVTFMWLPRDFHVDTTWLSCGNHVTSQWSLCIYNLANLFPFKIIHEVLKTTNLFKRVRWWKFVLHLVGCLTTYSGKTVKNKSVASGVSDKNRLIAPVVSKRQ